MAGTKEGGRKAALTNIQRQGDDFYSRIGRKGGKNGRTGGFFANRELAKMAGTKGGSVSSRGKAKKIVNLGAILNHKSLCLEMARKNGGKLNEYKAKK